MNQEEILICKCHSPEHQIIFRRIDDDDDKEVYMEILLNPEWKWWKRVREAVKYIFGHKSDYGMFDEVILKREDADKLQNIVNYLKS